MSAAAGVGSLNVSSVGSRNSIGSLYLSNDNAGSHNGAAAPPTTGNPVSVVPSAGGAGAGADLRNREPAVNILAPRGAGAGASPSPVTGLSAAERCAEADEDMTHCLSTMDQIAELEKQASVVCTHCDQIRAQIANLRKEIGAPAQIADIRKQIAAAPAPVAPTAGELRYGRAPQPIVKANIDAACGIQLPALKAYATGEGPVESANYKGKIKPLVDILSKSKDLKSLRDELKSYDPPGTFMSFFARRTAKNKAPLRNIAGRVSTALGCGVAAANARKYGVATIEAKTAAQAQLNATRAAAAAEVARRQREANAAEIARIQAQIDADRVAREKERKADPTQQAVRREIAEMREAQAIPPPEVILSKYFMEENAMRAAKRAAAAPPAPAPPAPAPVAAAPPATADTPTNLANSNNIFEMEGGARRHRKHQTHRRRQTRRHKGRKARKTAKK